MLAKNEIPARIALQEGEVILIDKPMELTSFNIIKQLREAYPGYVKKIGHAGTLDPKATGLLIICTGKMTKKISHFQDLEKEYTGTIRLGAVTPSYDAETEIIEEYSTEGIGLPEIEAAAKTFVGEIKQVPPAYSAIRIKGERAYKHAREGKKVELKERSINIYEFRIIEYRDREVSFLVRCSKGTYIRSLAHDLGKALGTGGYLSSLRRTAIGEFRVEDAFTPAEIKKVFNEQNESI